MGIISMVILARYRSFNSTLLLRNLAYEIALSIREAQVYGISVRGTGGVFTHASGIHFTRGTTYTLFTDLNDNNQYDGGTEAVSTYTIGDRKQITALCIDKVVLGACFTTIDVLFKRPDPDALFTTDGAMSAPNFITVEVGAPPDTNRRAVTIWPTGQISVE